MNGVNWVKLKQTVQPDREQEPKSQKINHGKGIVDRVNQSINRALPQNMVTPTAAPTRTPNHPALTVPALLVAEGVLLVLAAVDAAAADFDVVVAVAPVEDDAGAAVAPAKGAVDCPLI